MERWDRPVFPGSGRDCCDAVTKIDPPPSLTGGAFWQNKDHMIGPRLHFLLLGAALSCLAACQPKLVISTATPPDPNNWPTVRFTIETNRADV